MRVEDELQLILDKANAKHSSARGYTIRIAKTRPELGCCRDTICRAFATYRLYEWLAEGFTEAEKHEVDCFMSHLTQAMCRAEGFVLMAVDNANPEKVIGVLQFQHRAPSKWFVLRMAEATLFVGRTLFGSLIWAFPYRAVLWGLGAAKRSRLLARAQTLGALEDAHTVVLHQHGASPGDSARLSMLTGGCKGTLPAPTLAQRIVPDIEHLYVLQVGVDPELQSRGTGGALLEIANEFADKHSLFSFLETDEPRLENYYGRYGYATKHRYTMKAGESVFEPNYGMLRPPTSARL